MKTDWDLIRKALSAAIDACEVVEECGGGEELRGKVIKFENNAKLYGFDFLQSAFTYPDNLKSMIVRARHELKDNKPYTSETAKILINVTAMCAELVGATDTKTLVTSVDPHNQEKKQSIEEMVRNLTEWYKNYMISAIKKAE